MGGSFLAGEDFVDSSDYLSYLLDASGFQCTSDPDYSSYPHHTKKLELQSEFDVYQP